MKTKEFKLMTREERLEYQIKKVKALSSLAIREFAFYGEIKSWKYYLLYNYRVTENLIKFHGMEERYPWII